MKLIPRAFLSFLFLTLTVFAPLSAQEGKLTALQWYEIAQTAAQKENWYTSIEAYKRALQINPSYRSALEGLAEGFFILREYDESAKILEEARSRGPYSVTMKTLLGRAYLGQGRLEEAWALFQEVLKAEPQNVGALLGTAEHEILRNRFKAAEQIYQKILNQQPDHFRSLMSLLFLKQDRKEYSDIPKLLDRLLQSHSHEEKVHYYGALYWQQEGQLTRAKEFLTRHLSLTKGDGVPGRLLLAEILLEEGKPDEAIKELDIALTRDNQNTYAWYLKGYSQGMARQFDSSASSLGRAVFLDKENEFFRIALENPFIREAKLETGPRSDLASWHFNRAKELEQNLLPGRALMAYRRGLLIYPDSPQGRLSFARMMDLQGFRTTSTLTLNFLKGHVPTFQDRTFLDDLDIQNSIYRSSLPAEWGISLTDLGQIPYSRPYRISLFQIPELSSLPYYGATKDLSLFTQDELGYYRGVSISTQPEPVDSGVRGYQTSRSRGDDFFILLTFREGNRDFSARAQLYHSGTGRMIQEFAVYRKGQGRVSGAVSSLVQQIIQFLPPKGSIIQRHRSGNRFLINLGSRDQMKVGSKLQVIRENSLKIPGQDPFFTFNAEDLLGLLTLTRVDDFVSEGTFEQAGFFDVAAVRDEVISLVKPEAPPPAGDPISLSSLQRKILALR